MTPLAAYLAKQLIARPKHREGIWVEEKNRKHLRAALDDIHCFEVTKCLPLLRELADAFKRDPDGIEDTFTKFSFLPAPRTWIEWRHASTNRVGVLLEQISKDVANATFFCSQMACNLGQISTISGDYYDYGGTRYLPKWLAAFDNDPSAIPFLISCAHTMLLLINSPKIICRAQIMPNRALEHDLVRAMGKGSFPLHAWTEIQLKVNKPLEIDDGEPHEAHLTGRRALHFVRKHIRIRLGKLEYVSAHWRGDPALGIKRSRYAVMP